jgi:PD-(D/E)XK nuclease superfamily
VTVGGWESELDALWAEWRLVGHTGAPIVGLDENLLRTIRHEAAEIRARGEWVSGPADLLSVLGRPRFELFHSRVLGWLLNPTGRHGLGDAFLRAFLAELWATETFDTGMVRIELERPRAGISAVTGETVEARADLVLSFEALVVIIENKLDAGEQSDQCERLYWPWAEDPVDTRWVFLTPSGREPVTATSAAAKGVWRSMSYRQVRNALEAAVGVSPDLRSVGRATAQQYLATLIASVGS